MVGDELVMALTWEQGRGRESQVQPPLRIWEHYFGVGDAYGSLPTIRLINVRAPEEELEPPRPVVLYHHNLTFEVRGARGSRPAIARFREIGRYRYEYAVYRPGDVEYDTYDELLRTTDNPLRGNNPNERLWFIARRRRRRGEATPLAHELEAAARTARRAAAESNEVDAARDAVADLAGARAEGQGREGATPRRRAIERRAMEAAEAYFTGRGWNVEDVSDSRSYDIECTRGAEVLHVEVKGTTSRGLSILLTANEVAHARDFPHTALFVLHSIRVSGGDEPLATGGRPHVLNPWELDDERLEALAYKYTV